MFMLNIILTLIGITFFAFGYLVVFKKKYSLVALISGAKIRTCAAYAEEIGLISLMSGTLFIFSAISGLIFASVIFSVIMIAVCLAITSSMFVISTVRASKA